MPARRVKEQNNTVCMRMLHTSPWEGSFCLAGCYALRHKSQHWALRYLGSYGGTKQGGLAAMNEDLSPTSPPTVLEQQADIEPQSHEGIAPVANSELQTVTSGLVSEVQPSQPHPQIALSQIAGQGKAKFLTAASQLAPFQKSLCETFDDTDARWSRATVLVKKLQLDLSRLLAELPLQSQPVQQAMTINPLAPPGESLKRLKRAKERGRNRSRAPLRPPISAESPEKPERAEPFPLPKKWKQVTILDAAVSKINCYVGVLNPTEGQICWEGSLEHEGMEPLLLRWREPCLRLGDYWESCLPREPFAPEIDAFSSGEYSSHVRMCFSMSAFTPPTQ